MGVSTKAMGSSRPGRRADPTQARCSTPRTDEALTCTSPANKAAIEVPQETPDLRNNSTTHEPL